MSNTLCRWCALAVLVVPAASAQEAQSGRAAAGPQDAAAEVPRIEYRSVFTQYRRYTEQQSPAAWRETNETVNRIGGWRAYAREAAAAPPSSDPAAPAMPDAAKGHAGHPSK
jgi:hypothetical protein